MAIRSLFHRFLLCLSLIFPFHPAISQDSEYCCGRSIAFPSFAMPEGQERDISGFIASRWLSLILKMGPAYLGECPHPLTVMSWEGSLWLDSLTENMAVSSGVKKPGYDNSDEALKRFDYIWKGKLELLSVSDITPGYTEDAYIDDNTKPGVMHYEPGNAKGRWRFTIQLYNPQWDEVVKEATTPEWDGAGDHYYLDVVDDNRAKGLPDGPFDELFHQNFSNLKQIIYDYEKVPVKAEIKPTNVSAEAGEKKTITLNLLDTKGEKPKSWQRIIVEVRYGTLENGVECASDCMNNRYAFMCEDGEIDLRYLAPANCSIKTDHITVYNTCQTKHPSVVRLAVLNDDQDVIGESDIDITCDKAMLIIDYEENSFASGNGINERENIKARVSIDLIAEGDEIPMGADSKYLYSTYKIVNAKLESFAAAYEYHKHTKNENTDYMCTNAEPSFSGVMAPLFALYYDAETHRAISATIPEFGTEFLWIGSKPCRSEPGNADNIAIAPVEEVDNSDKMDAMAEKMEQLALQFDISEEDFDEELKEQRSDTTGKYQKGITPVQQFNPNIPFQDFIEAATDITTFTITNPGYNDWRASGNNITANGKGQATSQETMDGITITNNKTYRWYFRRGR